MTCSTHGVSGGEWGFVHLLDTLCVRAAGIMYSDWTTLTLYAAGISQIHHYFALFFPLSLLFLPFENIRKDFAGLFGVARMSAS